MSNGLGWHTFQRLDCPGQGSLAAHQRTSSHNRNASPTVDMRDLTVVTVNDSVGDADRWQLAPFATRLSHLDDERTQFCSCSGNLLAHRGLGRSGWIFHARRVDWRRALGLRGAPRIGALTQGVLLYFAILPPLFGVELASAVFLQAHPH